ncbi:Lipoprotein releasing system ATP-binding protein LolD [Paramagnetospirillum magnetotacticum MS-1]|uniref:Lipoprotein releasing system ATP-binding protein LolD n=1 Tax=Paramagnetospirillum magnetotacticum MS-1 TaxID=272627 RepID=A0A0C2YH05_PARME|nr:ABC transporter ATP-binding protein [Paramagnetospirillum magnetotacticum]KIL99009.1 Lipoprotein releasing system ATP-binding protein LolD [Paramagnetospirillum magnetotacticum MS-1]
MSNDGLKLENIRRVFKQGKDDLEVLKGANLEIRAGEIVALVGPSGAGKSTLLHIAGLLERPDAGEVHLAGNPAGSLGEGERTLLRRLHLGFVYQYHHLLPEFSAVENVILPQMIAGVSRSKAREKAMDLLARMKLAERAEHRPGQLSGGEQQRVAICRALANGPRVLLADEPTGNLDPHTAEGVFDELIRLVKGSGVAALIATHNPDLAARMDRVVKMSEGLLVEV